MFFALNLHDLIGLQDMRMTAQNGISPWVKKVAAIFAAVQSDRAVFTFQ